MSKDSEIPVLIRLRAVLAAVNDNGMDERSKAFADLAATIVERDVHSGLARHQIIAKELLYAALRQLEPSTKVKIASRLSSEKRLTRELAMALAHGVLKETPSSVGSFTSREVEDRADTAIKQNVERPFTAESKTTER